MKHVSLQDFLTMEEREDAMACILRRRHSNLSAKKDTPMHHQDQDRWQAKAAWPVNSFDNAQSGADNISKVVA